MDSLEYDLIFKKLQISKRKLSLLLGYNKTYFQDIKKGLNNTNTIPRHTLIILKTLLHLKEKNDTISLKCKIESISPLKVSCVDKNEIYILPLKTKQKMSKTTLKIGDEIYLFNPTFHTEKISCDFTLTAEQSIEYFKTDLIESLNKVSSSI